MSDTRIVCSNLSFSWADETPLFEELVSAMIPRAAKGEIAVPDNPGLGVRLDSAVLRRLRVD